MVVVEIALARSEPGRRSDTPTLDVDRLDRACKEVRTLAQAADRRDRIQAADAARDDLRQHRLGQGVLFAYKPHLRRPVPPGGPPPSPRGGGTTPSAPRGWP